MKMLIGGQKALKFGALRYVLFESFSSISKEILQYGRNNHWTYKPVAYVNFVGAYTTCLVRYEKWE